MRHDASFTKSSHEKACELLLRHINAGKVQEELSFALWRPATGAARKTALVFKIIPPSESERHLHGNVSFEPDYLVRAIRIACSEGAGLAFMHSHLSGGWQAMSNEDVIAERDRISAPARVTGFPLVGLTLGTDGSWSARFWEWDGRRFNRHWCDKVRVLGTRLDVTFNDNNIRPPRRRRALQRTTDTWGERYQRKIARLKIGVVGLGSVGCMVAEALARIGIERMVLIDPDKVEEHNLDRLLYATNKDVGKHKVVMTERFLKKSATAKRFHVQAIAEPIQNKRAYLAALDCDILVSAVDRPLPKDLLNRIAYAHCIPVISGGVLIQNKSDGTLSNAAWSVTTVGPGLCCLRCDGQYTSSDVTMERDGSLDDPGYIRDAPANQNVFPFCQNLAGFMVIELIRQVIKENWWPDIGHKFHYSMIPRRFSNEKKECGENCSISGDTAIGDSFAYPFLSGAGPKVSQPMERLTAWIGAKLRAIIQRGRGTS